MAENEPSVTPPVQVHKRICHICEAACGLLVEARGREVLRCRGNPDDVFSGGHICPKGVAIRDLDADPDRLRTPLIRRGDSFEEASWEEAFEAVRASLLPVIEAHGNQSVALYIGNPTAHNVGLSLGIGPLAGALQTRNLYSAGSVDQLPKQLACAFLFGNDMAIPVPDVERCDYLLMLGANPIVSNGSLWVVPDVRGKLHAMRQRGGHLTVVDPRRTETAALADEHHFIRPGTDAWLLAALCNLLLDAGTMPALSNLPTLPTRGLESLVDALRFATPERAAERTGMSVAAITAMANALRNAGAPAVYGRVGSTLQQFGTLTSFLIEVLNILLGALDRPGGAMFPEQPWLAPPATTGGITYARWHSRISGRPEVLGQMPVAVLAEEMESDGDEQIRALITIAGNPLVSNPDTGRLGAAFAELDFVLAIDIYRNETNQHADVILPGTSPLEDSHYDNFLGAMTWRNTARYSAPVFPVGDRPDEWDLMLTLACIVATGECPDASRLAAFEDQVIAGAAAAYTANGAPLEGQTPEEVANAIGPERGVERLLDLGIRAGRWGDRFGAAPSSAEGEPAGGLTLADLIATPDSIDLGPLESRLAEVLSHADGRIDLAPAPILDDLQRLQESAPEPDLLMIGRRNIQTNNSWLHNLPLLARGPNRAVLQMHPQDAEERQIQHGTRVRIQSSVTAVDAPVEVTEEMMRGTVSLPHGFSPNPVAGQSVARCGADSNALAPVDRVDEVSGTSALNGIPVSIRPIPA